MTELTFDDYNRMIKIQELLEDAGFKQYLKDGKTRPSYYQTDDQGRRIHGTNYIVNPVRNNCFHRGEQHTFRPVDFIVVHPEMFAEWNSKTDNRYYLAHLVCRRILNMPEEARRTTYALNSPTRVKFDIDSYQRHTLDPKDRLSWKAFYPYFAHRKISGKTQNAFKAHFFITEKSTPTGAITLKNLSFPMYRPNDLKTPVGLEVRGMGKKDGTSYKGMASGSDHSTGMWIAPLGTAAGTDLSNAKHVYWFESAYDAMAYYQLHSQDETVKNGVFISTGGNPTEAQMKGMIKATTLSAHHLCFDNDEAGNNYAASFNKIISDMRKQMPKVTPDMEEYMKSVTDPKDIYLSGNENKLPNDLYDAYGNWESAEIDLEELTHSYGISNDIDEIAEAKSVAQKALDDYKQMMDEKLCIGSEYSRMKEIGEYDIPEWAVCAIENGDRDNLTEEEEKALDNFLDREEFKDGFTADWDWEDTDEMNLYPAFGERNEKALTNRGESPYLAVSTVKAHFYHPYKREVEVLPGLTTIRDVPREGCKDWNEQLKEEVAEEERQHQGEKTERGTLHRTEGSGMDLDGDGLTDDVEVDQDVENKKRQTFGRSHH